MTQHRDGYTPKHASEIVHSHDSTGSPNTLRTEDRTADRESFRAETAGESTATLVGPVQRDIDKFDRMLAETVPGKLDPQTGREALRYQGDARRRLEVQRHHLVAHELPYAQQRGAAIDAANAAKGTAAERLQAQHDRQLATRARAEQLADEAEAQELAKRIAAQRRSKLGIG